jgi:hypothetical protein
VHRALLSVAVALAGAAGVGASGWALQAAALPPPKPAARVAVDAITWLHEHRLVVDVFHSDGRRMEGACLRGWFPAANGVKGPASLLAVGSEATLRVSTKQRVALLEGRPSLPDRILALVGCSGMLGPVFGRAAQNGGRLTTERSYAANEPAIALRLERAEARLTIYVSPRTFRPLVAFADVEGRAATARLYLSRATPRRLRRFHLPEAHSRKRPR